MRKKQDPPRLGIALGSNIRPRLEHLARARDAIRDALPGPGEILHAPVYESAPDDCPPGSPAFLNTVIEVPLPADALSGFFARCQAIERELGRAPVGDRPRHAPRPADIDLLYFTGDAPAVAGLDLPHPRLAERAFVLVPLAAILPERVPGPGQATAAALLARLGPSAAEDLTMRAQSW